MSDIPPASAPVPDYNTPAKNKFQIAKFLTEADGTYSSFWPLLIVFTALIILMVYDVSYLRYRKLVQTEELSQLVSKEKGGQAQQAFIEGMHRDLDVMAPKHPDVAAILNEFFPPASSPATATPPSK